jgi:hypothetical protein
MMLSPWPYARIPDAIRHQAHDALSQRDRDASRLHAPGICVAYRIDDRGKLPLREPMLLSQNCRSAAMPEQGHHAQDGFFDDWYIDMAQQGEDRWEPRCEQEDDE